MPRRFTVRALVISVTLLAAGCQDYNFNPVGQCVIQPGAERVALSNISTADVLFVVDDSGSMGGEQAALADNFSSFIANLDATNLNRKDAGLKPIDFHIAVTTSSVFWNFETTQTCSSSCAGAEGQNVCCLGTTPARQPRKCTSDAQCGGLGAGVACRTTCVGLKGEGYCCAADDSFPPSAIADLVPCSRPGTQCGKLETHYAYQGGCLTGTAPRGIAPAESGWPYPRGDFVGVDANPRVLHFDKRLYESPDARNAQGFDSATLQAFFRQNVLVGTCGSGQEQALQASRLALQKALSGQQRDTWTFDPNAAGTATQTWNAGTRTAGSPAQWPNPNSKLVLVFVGDEDDCSSPQDPSGGVVMLGEPPGSDACSRDATDAPPVGGKQFPVSEFVSYFTSLGRPVAAGFIFPAAQTQCTLQSCTTEGLCCPAGGCSSVDGAQARGTRLLSTASALAAAGVEVVAGSICDPDFGQLLNDIAEIVKPPQTLTLPSTPADSEITLLRIMGPNGDTRKLCGRPLAQGGFANVAEAQATGADWWFTAFDEPGVPVPVSRFVYINPQGGCRANPGETYSADYLGVVPAGGCARMPEDGPPEASLGSVDCQAKLGGRAESWDCFVPPGMPVGTCTCRSEP
jgi:hypothetical protein